MTNKKFMVGMLVMTLVFGMTVVGCGGGGDGSSTSSSGGGFTLTGIPSKYNGKYAFFADWVTDNYEVEIFGAQSYNLSQNTVTGVQISDGKVSIPVWNLIGVSSAERYSGNHTFNKDTFVGIFESATLNIDDVENDITLPIGAIEFISVTFTNGNATKSWNNGTVYE